MIETKESFIKNVNRLIAECKQYNSGLEFSLKLSQLYNDKIQNLTKDCPDDLAIAAIGGLSRMELSPFSDIDVIFITNSIDEHKDYITNTIQKLWDNGIGVSHSVRTFNQIFEFAENDLFSFTQFLEMRFISGSHPVFLKFLENLRNIVNSELKKDLLDAYLIDIDKRHNTYGKSPLLLEPNIKNTRGGIRDLHSSAWIYYILNNELPIFDKFDTAVNYFLLHAVNSDTLTTSEAKSIYDAYDYLIKLRNALHIVNSNSRDRIDFQAQLNVTRYFFNENSELDAMHIDLMKKYFEATFKISSTLEIFYKEALKFIHPCETYKTYQLDEDFILCGRFIRYQKDEKLSLPQILQAFHYQVHYDAIFDNELDDAIRKSIEYFDGTEITKAEVKKSFKKFFQRTENLSDALFNMHRLGVLGFLIPEFDSLKLFFQPNAYHIYTTDEHTLMAIKNLYNLELDNSLIGEIFRKYENKDLLILAVLFHDIAKPITHSGHELVGSQIAENIMQRYGYSDTEIEMVKFLVENHLLMEQTAFRRNLNDVNILNSFRSKFKNIQELDYLYLLTYADLSAVNPSLWTTWKSSLLNELYTKTREMILFGITAEELLSPKIEKFDFEKFSIDKKDYLNHIEQINDTNYLYTFSEEEIASHINEIKKGNVLSILHNNTEDFTQLTVITRDTKGLLSKICGSISVSDCNIHDANIFTRKDGIIIDTFKITDFISHKPLTEDHFEALAETISRVLLQSYNLDKAFEEHRDKWKRIDKRKMTPIDVEVKFEEHPIYTIIDIHASDRIGLLYLITKKLTELGLNIYFAKIGTKLNGAFDSFYVLNENFQKIPIYKYDVLRKELVDYLSNFEEAFSS
jgi:[protein-PII] uridylyltransferase